MVATPIEHIVIFCKDSLNILKNKNKAHAIPVPYIVNQKILDAIGLTMSSFTLH